MFVGKIDFEGVGWGILWNSKGNKIYEGWWKNNKYHGFGKEYYGNFYHKIKYMGGWTSHMRVGWGMSYFENGKLEFQGTWVNDAFSGFGKLFEKTGLLGYKTKIETGASRKGSLQNNNQN